ncbi:MAG: RNA methyltransferase, partial [Clostridia bacterium]|nr:RNA methyltransferase [Clostridia bacterium]
DKARIRHIASHLRYIRAMGLEYGFPVEETDSETIAAYAVGSSHGGILTFCTDRTLPALTEIGKQDGFYVMLNGIEDPYNFGYALRSLYASGADGVILSKRNWMTAAGVVSRASAGASEQMPLYVAENEAEVIRVFHGKGYRIVSADLENSKPMKDADLRRPLLLAIGGEKRGLSKELLSVSDEIVRIDYGREFKESLSAASAAAILSFAVLSQNPLDE